MVLTNTVNTMVRQKVPVLMTMKAETEPFSTSKNVL